MRLESLKLSNFRSIKDADICLGGRSAVFFGGNGTGKSSILRSINLLYANFINQIVNRKELKQSYAMRLEDIQYGASETKITAILDIDNQKIEYARGLIRKSGRKTQTTDTLKQISALYQERYISDEEQGDIPIFANYGTNRLVLDIPLRIRTHHTFDIYSAFESAIENKIDFRTFFEWYRNQEDYENEKKIESGNLRYKDVQLEAVRTAIASMVDECSNLRVVRKPRLEMKIDKDNMSLNVSQMSDGEKCTMALLGDLARRLALANPTKSNPLLGEGIVLIDEVELHMHPSWQRKVLRKLRETFPNIQFIVTTHSPIVLSEVDENYNLFFLNRVEGATEIQLLKEMDGYDTNTLLEDFMDTTSVNPKTIAMIHSINMDIAEGNYSEANKKIDKLAEKTSDNNPEVLMARMEIMRRTK